MEKVIEDHIDPVVAKQRENHFASLADIAGRFIRGLENVSRPDRNSDSSPREAYLVPSGDAVLRHDELTKEQLAQRLKQNIQLILEYKARFYRTCFVPHLKNELPEEIRAKLLSEVIEETPFELISFVAPLAVGKPFPGICPRCRHWAQPFACPISHA